MLELGELPRALKSVKLYAVSGPWTRAVAFKHLYKPAPGPLYGGGAKTNGARFTPKGSFDCVYLAQDPITALSEIASIFTTPDWEKNARFTPPNTPPWTLFTVKGIIPDVLDLTDTATCVALNTSISEIGGPWRTVDNPPTQTLGWAAFQNGSIKGIKYKSSKEHEHGVCVVVFSDRVMPSTQFYLEVYDPENNLRQRIHPDK
jgi:RES domain-containing protein